MPIRTPRGRSAAYRALWQWPLRTPGRLAMIVAVVLLVVVGVTFGLSLLRGPAPVGPAAPATAAPGPGAAGSGVQRAPAPGATAAASPLPLSQAPPEALQTAERWAKAWVRPRAGTTAQEWLDGLQPLTTEQYLGVLGAVDPENVPATRVTGRATAVWVADRTVRAEVPTDTLTLRLQVVDTDEGWRIANYDRV